MNIFYNTRKAINTLCITVMLIATACGNNKTESAPESGFSLEMDTIAYRDSLTELASSKIIVTTNSVLPSLHEGNTSSGNLVKLISKTIFNTENDDSIASLHSILKNFTDNILNSYRMPEGYKTDSTYKNNKTFKYEIINDIKPVYSNNRILCFCRISEMKKDGTQTMLSRHYYSFDTKESSRISITDIFKEEDINIVNKLLKDKLMQQENVESQSQLIDLGYFNIENLEVNNNLYFTDKGIVFNYEPFEIACFAVGDVSIELDYDTVRPYFNSDFTNKL